MILVSFKLLNQESAGVVDAQDYATRFVLIHCFRVLIIQSLIIHKVRLIFLIERLHHLIVPLRLTRPLFDQFFSDLQACLGMHTYSVVVLRYQIDMRLFNMSRIVIVCDLKRIVALSLVPKILLPKRLNWHLSDYHFLSSTHTSIILGE
jgi:hypothetical protein